MESIIRMGHHYKLMFEYVGNDLTEQIIDLTLSQMDSVMKQLIWTITILHKAGIAHMDIKPDNVTYDVENDRIVLLDFEEAVHKSAPKFVYCGSPMYIAPMMMKREITHSMDFGYQCDSWSLMVTCLTIACKNMPFPQSCICKDNLEDCSAIYPYFTEWVKYLKKHICSHLADRTQLPTVVDLKTAYENLVTDVESIDNES